MDPKAAGFRQKKARILLTETKKRTIIDVKYKKAEKQLAINAINQSSLRSYEKAVKIAIKKIAKGIIAKRKPSQV